MAIKKQTQTKYYDDKEMISYTFEPVDGSLTVVATENGWEARYLAQDNNIESPEMDDNLFLVAFHRDFEVKRDKIITKTQCRHLGYNLNDLEKDEAEFIVKFASKYYIFYLEAYIHSGVTLALRGHGNFCDRQWDVSQLGCVFVSREEWTDMENAKKAAASLIEEWNYALSGEVYGCVIEQFDKDKKLIDYDSCWGYSGYRYAIEELKTFR